MIIQYFFQVAKKKLKFDFPFEEIAMQIRRWVISKLIFYVSD